MPVISCGGMRYQFKWQDVDPKDIPAANQANLEATIHRSLELGINHIETARGYGCSVTTLGEDADRLHANPLGTHGIISILAVRAPPGEEGLYQSFSHALPDAISFEGRAVSGNSARRHLREKTRS